MPSTVDRDRGPESPQWSEHLRQAWTKATERNTPQERAYRLGYQVGDDGEGGEGHFTDLDVAYAWLYQDVAHGDPVTLETVRALGHRRGASDYTYHLVACSFWPS